MQKIASSIVFMAILLNSPWAVALGKEEYCQVMAEVGVETLEMLDRSVPLDDAINTINGKYSKDYPDLSLDETVRALYLRGLEDLRGDEYRKLSLEICWTM